MSVPDRSGVAVDDDTSTTSPDPATRRDFLTRASLLGLGIPALGSILTGCTREGADGIGGAGGPQAGQGATQSSPATEVVTFQRYDPTLPPVGPGREHDFHFVVRDVTLPIANQVAMRAWTFNGTVPGPIVHVRQGDTVRVHLTNEGAAAHSIDMHAAQIDTGTAFRSIPPGESLTYTFTPHHAGAFLYHCGTEPIGLHIGSGMYGAIIVDPPSPLPPAREFVLVHSSFYIDRPQGTGPLSTKGSGQSGAESDSVRTGAQGGGSAPAAPSREEMPVYDPSYEKMLFTFPDFTAFNGHTFQYRAEPIRVKQGERVRFYVVSAGPTQDCAFHLVGEIFDTIYIAEPPGNTITGVQTFAVPAGGGMIFELLAETPGTFVFVNHKMGHGDKGAKGVLIVEP